MQIHLFDKKILIIYDENTRIYFGIAFKLKVSQFIHNQLQQNFIKTYTCTIINTVMILILYHCVHHHLKRHNQANIINEKSVFLF